MVKRLRQQINLTFNFTDREQSGKNSDGVQETQKRREGTACHQVGLRKITTAFKSHETASQGRDVTTHYTYLHEMHVLGFVPFTRTYSG